MRRKYREREQQENVAIIIPVILCLVARAQKTQYTKRLLPEFLIPHSVIRLDNLLEAAELAETERSESCGLRAHRVSRSTHRPASAAQARGGDRGGIA